MVLRSCKVKGPVESLNVRSTGGGQCSQLLGANVLIIQKNLASSILKNPVTKCFVGTCRCKPLYTVPCRTAPLEGSFNVTCKDTSHFYLIQEMIVSGAFISQIAGDPMLYEAITSLWLSPLSRLPIIVSFRVVEGTFPLTSVCCPHIFASF